MKRTFLFIFLVFSIFFIGCDQQSMPPSPAERILSGEHELRKMTERMESKSSASGQFFLLWGSYSQSSSTSLNVKFSWKMNDGMYAISSLPIEKFRIQFNEAQQVPTIKFRWTRSRSNQIQDIMETNVLYVVLIIKESDWPTNINLPLQ